MISKQITDFQPYKVTFGDSITSQWYEFSTWNPKTGPLLLYCIERHASGPRQTGPAAESRRRTKRRYQIFYVGDMMNYYDNEAVPFQSFIDTSVSLFATERPFVLVRGNHETRGNKAREYNRYVPKSDGKYYGAYRIGDVMFVIMDCGEGQAGRLLGLCGFDRFRTATARSRPSGSAKSSRRKSIKPPVGTSL